MKVGLIDIDNLSSKRKHGGRVYPNLALCKVAAWHKAQGDSVEWYEPLLHEGMFDKVYMSKIFNFSLDYPYSIDAREVERGGTGYDITKELPRYIDDMQPDYSIYPAVPAGVSYGFLTRGCPNRCRWCVVPKKEGGVHPYWDIERVANGNKSVVLMDNNILAAGEYCIKQLGKIVDLGLKVDFNQALDARLVNGENAALLAKVKWIDRRIRFGCDTKAQIGECMRAMDLLIKNGFVGEFFLYTMLHGDFTECYERAIFWRRQLTMHRNKEGGVNAYAYAQPYRDPYGRNEVPQWQKDMARWINRKELYWNIDFKEYEPRKGFKCKKYFQLI